MRSWDFGERRIRIFSKRGQYLVRTWEVSLQRHTKPAAIEDFSGQSIAMKYRAYNSYLCIVRDRVGPRKPPLARPSVLANPAGRKTGVILPARRANSTRQPFKNVPAGGLSSAKKTPGVRVVDSPTLVIQSRITPRARLRAVAQTLRRLERPAAGFVFNRVLIRKVKPWFPQAVPGVEQRIGVPRPPLPTRSSEPRPSETAQELPVVTKRELVKPADSALSPDASPQPATPQQQVATPFSVPAPTGASSPDAESAPPPRVARGRGEPQRPAHASRTSRPAAPTSRRAVPPPAAEPLAPVPSAQPAPAVNPIAEHAAALAPVTPDQTPLDDLVSEPAGYPPSRLSGLRNLLVSLGRRSLGQDDEVPQGADPDIEPRFERATVRPAYQDSIVSADGAPENGVPTRLTAQPEFLPPRPATEADKERDKEAVRPTPPRRDSSDGEEIQTLPSWRGQYRKKRYPPI